MLLQVRDLTRRYSRNGASFAAVDRAGFDLSAGDFAVITGRSGSGKSTLLNLIAGLVRPSSGSVLVDGREIANLPDRAASDFRNAVVGFVPQNTCVLSSLNVLDNVRLPYSFKTRPGDAAERAEALSEQVGITRLKDAYPKQLSGGELRRVSIARALINEPKLLIADEPTGDLDERTTLDILDLLEDIARSGTAVLMVTHDPAAASRGNRRFAMDAGVLAEREMPPSTTRKLQRSELPPLIIPEARAEELFQGSRPLGRTVAQINRQ